MHAPPDSSFPIEGRTQASQRGERHRQHYLCNRIQEKPKVARSFGHEGGGAIVAFTRSLPQGLVEKGIRANGVAPGPIWTPLIPSTFPPEEVASFGADVTVKRPGQPEEVAHCYLFLASSDSSYLAGQILHPHSGEVVNG